MKQKFLFATMLGLALVSSGLGAEPAAAPASGGSEGDVAVVLDGTTLWRQFNVGFNPGDAMGALHVRATNGTLLLTAVDYVVGQGDVTVPDEDVRKVYLWQDARSPFYGSYEEKNRAAQRRGEAVPPAALQ